MKARNCRSGSPPRCGRPDHLGGGAEHIAQDLAIQGGLVPQVIVEHRLVHSRAGSYPIDLRAVEPAGGEPSPPPPATAPAIPPFGEAMF
jgi:hypothetical protein